MQSDLTPQSRLKSYIYVLIDTEVLYQINVAQLNKL